MTPVSPFLQMTSILFAFKSCYAFGRLSFKSFAAVKQNPPSKIQEISWLAKYFCSTSRFFCQHSSGCPDVSMGRATIKDCNCKTLVSPAEFRRRVSVCGLDSLVSSKLLAALWCAASYQPGQGFRFNFLLFIKNCFSEGDFCLRSAYRLQLNIQIYALGWQIRFLCHKEGDLPLFARFREICEKGGDSALKSLGQLMTDSHNSCSHFYEWHARWLCFNELETRKTCCRLVAPFTAQLLSLQNEWVLCIRALIHVQSSNQCKDCNAWLLQRPILHF